MNNLTTSLTKESTASRAVMHKRGGGERGEGRKKVGGNHPFFLQLPLPPPCLAKGSSDKMLSVES